jgi:hypothetical protein
MPRLRRLLFWLAIFASTFPGSVGALDPATASAPAADAVAAALVDRLDAALGGRGAWEATRFLTWSFFGRRRHVWDKATGDIRVEAVGRDDGVPYVVLMNLHTGRGRAWRGGQEVTDPAELAAWLDRGEAAWINDSYWMFMPYKLRDPGVRLRYLGAATMADGRAAEVVELTFEGVGRTPENKYRVYVATETNLVEQWEYFERAGDAEPGLSTPWRGWQRYGAILLSDDRGETGRHTGIAVLDTLPPSVLASPDPVDWAALGVVE